MNVYHGTTEVVDHPLTGAGRPNLDFGPGFYITDIKQQAKEWAQRVAALRNLPPVLNTYTLDKETAIKEYRYRHFDKYDHEWLDFIASNRRGKGAWKDYDIVEGGVANDRVIDTVEAYMAGLMTEDVALERLQHHKPNNQICILNQEIVDKYLRFVKSQPL